MWEEETTKLKAAKVVKSKWPAKLKCAWKQVVIAMIKLLEAIDNFGEDQEESFDLGLDASSSKDERETEE